MFNIIEKLYLAYHDSLTGCFNRNYYEKVISKKYNNKQVTIAYIDVDDFKQFNDYFGHDAGDKALSSIARHLIGCTYDPVVRMGGDEFLIVSNESEEVIINYLSYIKFISFGVCIKEIKDNFLQSIKRAEKDMYAMKRSHKEMILNDITA
jgi:GGDEF domain-containing protein